MSVRQLVIQERDNYLVRGMFPKPNTLLWYPLLFVHCISLGDAAGYVRAGVGGERIGRLGVF